MIDLKNSGSNKFSVVDCFQNFYIFWKFDPTCFLVECSVKVVVERKTSNNRNKRQKYKCMSQWLTTIFKLNNSIPLSLLYNKYIHLSSNIFRI